MQIKLKPGVKLFATQKSDLALLCKHSRFCNFSEMGAGKTLPSAILSLGVVEDDLCDYSIIVTPKIVVGDWYKTFTDQMDCDYKKDVLVYNAPTVLRPFVELKPVTIMSYDTYYADKVRWDKLVKKYRVMLTFDEAHWIRNHESGRGALSAHLAKYAKRVYLLTGSPYPNGLRAAYSYLNILEPDVHYVSHKHFILQHYVYSPSDRRKLIGYKNVEKITALMSRLSVRHYKKEMLDLPPVTFTTRTVSWNRAQVEAYKEFQSMAILETEKSWIEATTAATMAMRLHQIITNPKLLGLDCDSNKFQTIEEDLEAIDLSKNKVVIYAHYRGTIDRLLKRLKDYNPAAIYGKVSDSEGQKRKFLEDDSCRLMVANAASAGIGVNFTVSSYFIFFEYAYDLDSYDQAVSRGNRPGQTAPLTIINYALKGSMEIRKILPRLVSKKEFSMYVLQDPDEFIEFINLDEEEALVA